MDWEGKISIVEYLELLIKIFGSHENIIISFHM